nr:thiamine phosphate synthase [Marinobacter santoriniensis]
MSRPGLYAITDTILMPADRLVPAVEAALRGGAVLVQYRDKTSPHTDRLRQASALVSACHNAGVPLIINDDYELARRVGADGVHLGQEDGAVTEARALLGEQAIVGVTCHASLDLARTARSNGADYLAFGRFYTSGTKPDAPKAAPEVLTRARSLGRPLTAIGGVTTDNGAELIRAGADMLAVVGGLFSGTPDQIEQRARTFTQLFATHHPLYPISSKPGAQP